MPRRLTEAGNGGSKRDEENNACAFTGKMITAGIYGKEFV